MCTPCQQKLRTMSTDAAFTAQTGTTWAVMAFVGEPPAVVRVRNLQTTTTSGADAWGRRSKRQPLLVTAEIAFREPFGTSAEHDRLDNDTVDYGTLSTRLLAAVERCDNFHREHASDCSLASLAGHLLDDLAGTGRVGPEFRAISPKPLLTSTAHVFSIRLHLHLPKATLTGEGVSADFVIAFAHFPPSDPADVRPGAAGGLAAGRHALHGLRLPVVVGLREHEKTFEQSVLISVEFEHLSPPISIYNEVEQTVIKVHQNPPTLSISGSSVSNASHSHADHEEQDFRDSRGPGKCCRP